MDKTYTVLNGQGMFAANASHFGIALEVRDETKAQQPNGDQESQQILLVFESHAMAEDLLRHCLNWGR